MLNISAPKFGLLLLITVALNSGVVAAQTPSANTKEIVITSTGQPHSPWVEATLCLPQNRSCGPAIYNPETDEIARWRSRLSTEFERTGNGAEIRRAETSVEKAIRLQSTPTSKN
jgi:hypothetical protein